MPKYVVNPNAKSNEEIDDEEIIMPLEKPEFEEALRWLKDGLDLRWIQRDYCWEVGVVDAPLHPTSNDVKTTIEKPEFIKFLQYLDLEKPDAKCWYIPKYLTKEQLKSMSEMINYMINSLDILGAYGIDLMKCKGCNYDFTNILLHLNKSKSCPAKYSEQDMQKLKELKKNSSKLQKKEWYKHNKEQLSKKMSSYFQENREIILQRMKERRELRKNHNTNNC